MPTKKTPASQPLGATLAAALTALLALPLLPGPTVGQATDGAVTKDPTPVARAATGTYFHASLGATSLMGYDEGYALTAGLGDYAVFDRFRGEVELSLASMSSVRALTATANAYYDYHNRTAWTPFVGLGVGIGSEAYSGSGGRGWSEPAYSRLHGTIHGNLGVAYAATDDLTAQLAFRAFGGPGTERGWVQMGVRLNR